MTVRHCYECGKKKRLRKIYEPCYIWRKRKGKLTRGMGKRVLVAFMCIKCYRPKDQPIRNYWLSKYGLPKRDHSCKCHDKKRIVGINDGGPK